MGPDGATRRCQAIRTLFLRILGYAGRRASSGCRVVATAAFPPEGSGTWQSLAGHSCGSATDSHRVPFPRPGRLWAGSAAGERAQGVLERNDETNRYHSPSPESDSRYGICELSERCENLMLLRPGAALDRGDRLFSVHRWSDRQVDGTHGDLGIRWWLPSRSGPRGRLQRRDLSPPPVGR